MDDDVSCRICRDTESSEPETFMTPCKCTGSMKYVHSACLKNYIKFAYQTKQMEALYCTVCTEPYTGIRVTLLALPRPKQTEQTEHRYIRIIRSSFSCTDIMLWILGLLLSSIALTLESPLIAVVSNPIICLMGISISSRVLLQPHEFDNTNSAMDVVFLWMVVFTPTQFQTSHDTTTLVMRLVLWAGIVPFIFVCIKKLMRSFL